MDIYSEIILDHYYHPRHAVRLACPTVTAQEFNPVCGDKVVVDVVVEHGLCSDIGVVTEGCAISRSAASLLAEKIIGQSVAQVREIGVDDVMSLLGVTISPARAKCALLGWSAVKVALNNYSENKA